MSDPWPDNAIGEKTEQWWPCQPCLQRPVAHCPCSRSFWFLSSFVSFPSVTPLLFATAALTLLPVFAHGHGIKLFATAENHRITGQAYFTGGEPVKEGEIQLRDSNDRLVQTVPVNTRGRFSCQTDHHGQLRLVLDLASGHRAETTLRVPANSSSDKDSPNRSDKTASAAQPGGSSSAGGRARVRQTKMPKAVAQAVEQELDTLRADLHQHRNRVKLRDVVGGIGWIMGLLGLWFFLRGKYERTRSPSPRQNE